jgi:hypothetical protein
MVENTERHTRMSSPPSPPIEEEEVPFPLKPRKGQIPDCLSAYPQFCPNALYLVHLTSSVFRGHWHVPVLSWNVAGWRSLFPFHIIPIISRGTHLEILGYLKHNFWETTTMLTPVQPCWVTFLMWAWQENRGQTMQWNSSDSPKLPRLRT